ncbi:MAG: MamK family actin-like protein [Planctomycetota bacterium JB042]
MTVETSKDPESSASGETEKEHGVLYVGMDLGTSRTSVACSNGVRETVASVIGYPKDVVARKHLKKDVLYGKEAFQNRLSVDFYRPLAHGVIKGSDSPESTGSDEGQMNQKAAADLVQHAIRLATPRPDELLYGVIGCPAQASIHNRKAIIEAAREVLDSVMICSEPFAVAYGLDRLADVLVIDIGAGTTDLCRMHGTMPAEEDQITTTYAGDHIDQTLLERIGKRLPDGQVNHNMVAQWKERWGTVRETVQPIVVKIPVKGKPTEVDITEDMRAACRTIIGPIVDGLAELIGSFDPEFQDRLKGNVLLGGGGSQIAGLGDAIEQEMANRLGGGSVTTVEEPIYAGANGALKIAHDMPEEYWERLK